MVTSLSAARRPPAVRDATLLDALERRANGQRPWLVFHQGPSVQHVSAGDALERGQQWATAFIDAGVAPGQCVGIWQPNAPDFVAAFFGALLAGATPVPLAWPVIDSNVGATLERLRPILDRAHVRCISAPVDAGQPNDPARSWPLRAMHRTAPHQPTLGPEQPAFIQFTSGSTGLPRGAVISHAAALSNATALVAGLGLTPDDVAVSWVPFFHDMGLIGVLLSSLVGGFEVHVLRPSAFLLHPWHWLELVTQVRATLTVAPDFGYAFAARRCGARSFSLETLRCALTGSEPIQRSTLDAFTGRFGRDGFRPEAFVGAYGLAENTLGVSAGPALARTFVDPHGRRLPSVGQPLPGVEVRVERSGEICVRSPSLFTGYFEDDDGTAGALKDGWLHTGDLGVIDRGHLFIVGREKDLIIKNGSKFHPAQFEELVAKTVDAPPNGVVAFNDDEQHLVVAIEQRRASFATDSTSVRSLIAEHFGVRVDRVEWVPAGTLPHPASGKLRRHACAELLSANDADSRSGRLAGLNAVDAFMARVRPPAAAENAAMSWGCVNAAPRWSKPTSTSRRRWRGPLKATTRSFMAGHYPRLSNDRAGTWRWRSVRRRRSGARRRNEQWRAAGGLRLEKRSDGGNRADKGTEHRSRRLRRGPWFRCTTT